MGDVSAAQLFGAQFCGAEFGRAILLSPPRPLIRYRDSNGYLGYSADEKKAAEPRLVALQGGALIKQIASGADHTLAVGANGVDVYSWGCGEKGQIGCGISWEAGEKGTLGRVSDLAPHTHSPSLP